MHIRTLEWLSPSRFQYSLPFTLSGQAYGQTQEQFKREITVVVAPAFPAVMTRVRVTDEMSRVKCPIANSIDDLERRNALLQSEIELAKKNPCPDCKTLAHVLKGSVDPHVHGGIPEIIRVFLENPKTIELIGTTEKERFQHELKQSLSNFMALAHEALHLNRVHNPSSTLLQMEFEKGFQEIQSLLSSHEIDRVSYLIT